MTLRHTLADAYVEALATDPPGGNPWRVYDYPPDLIEPPAVVLVPGDPYQQITGGGGPAGRVSWLFDVTIVGPSGDAASALTAIEAVRSRLAPITGRWEQLGKLRTVNIGGVDYLGADLRVILSAPDE